MIQAKQLRLGNFVISNFKGTDRICEVVYINSLECSLQFSDDEDIYCISYATLINIHPIPLTEEWLLKFGFVYIEKKDSFRIEYTIKQYEVANGKSISLHIRKHENDDFYAITLYEIVAMDDVTPTIIKYVHQLQNLYKALTNEELTINQP